MSNATTATLGIVLMIMAGIGGAVMDNIYNKHQYANYVKLENTKSGTFFIKDERIYSVSELHTEQQFAGSITHVK